MNFRLFLNYMLLVILVFVSEKQNAISQESPMFFDAVSFQSDSLGLVRLDCFAVMPYSELKFLQNGDNYVSKYSLKLSVIDQSDKLVAFKKIDRVLSADKYFTAQGGAGDFDFVSYSFNLLTDKYKVRLELIDDFANKEYQKVRNISLIDFNEYSFSLSGLMLVSKIEENSGEYSITPHLTDNVSQIMKSFFVLFETYNKLNAQNIKFVLRVYDSKNEIKYQSDFTDRNISEGKSSQYLNIKLPRGMKQGQYTLRVFALNELADSSNIDNNIIAGAERSIALISSIDSEIYEDINKAIEQCRFVAKSEELDIMRDAKSNEDKILKFEEFWKALDPTIGTDRNEAFDLYFQRVELANRKFKGTWGDGWKSDMGAVYIVYGNPTETERSTPDYRGRVLERWTYSNGKVFVFVDNNGFGDFRLSQPYMVSDKFRYDY